MDLSSAISEFAEMLAVGSQALQRLAAREAVADASDSICELLGETQDIALRLSVIAAELRSSRSD